MPTTKATWVPQLPASFQHHPIPRLTPHPVQELLDMIQVFMGVPPGIPEVCSPRAATRTVVIPCQDGVPTHAWVQEQHGAAWIGACLPQLHAHQHQTCLDIPRNLSNTGIQTELPILLQCLKKAGKSLPLWHSSALPLCRAESALCTWAAGSSWARLGSWSPASCRRHSQSPWQSPQ